MWTLLLSLAFADIIPPQPASACPEGAHWATSGGRWVCAPATCTTDGDCTDGTTCQEQKLCLAESSWSRQVGAPSPDNPPRTFTAVSVRGPCTDEASCEGRCEAQKVCMTGQPKAPAPAPVPTPPAAPVPTPAAAPVPTPTAAPVPSDPGCSHLPWLAGSTGLGGIFLLVAARRRPL